MLANRNVRSETQGTANRCPELHLRQRVASLRERIARVEPLVAQVPVGTPAPRVRPRLRDDVHGAGGGAAELGGAAGGDDLELVHDLLAEVRPGQRRRIVIRRQAVDEKRVVEVSLSRHRDAGSGNGGRLGKAVRVAGDGPRHAGSQQCEVEIIAAVQREAVHLRGRHALRSLGPCELLKIGASAATVMVSVTSARTSTIGIVTACPMESVNVRVNGLNPLNSAVMR